MSGPSNIGWTDRVWNCVVGCARVSPGCERCYAEAFTGRLEAMGQDRYRGLTVVGKQGRHWTGEIRLVPEVLATPLHWKKPARVFVNSMSDLFHKDVPFDYIAAVFGVMAACPHHIFQVLTKRPERALEFFGFHGGDYRANIMWWLNEAGYKLSEKDRNGWRRDVYEPLERVGFGPLPWVHLGVSVEDQQRADERIPTLLDCPAAVRWISYEPALGPLDLDEWIKRIDHCSRCGGEFDPQTIDSCPTCRPGPGLIATWGTAQADAYRLGTRDPERDDGPLLDWVVSGGESGPGRREVDVSCIENVARACKAAGVPHFTKQDGGPRPGSQGRISDEVWAMKEYPR